MHVQSDSRAEHNTATPHKPQTEHSASSPPHAPETTRSTDTLFLAEYLVLRCLSKSSLISSLGENSA
jgi:hypothetical protein